MCRNEVEKMSTTLKPSRFWPATRARNFVKKIDPSAGRQTFDANIRYLAEIYDISPEEFLDVNPLDFSKKIGLSYSDVRSLIDRYDIGECEHLAFYAKRMREEPAKLVLEPVLKPAKEEKQAYDIADWSCVIV